MKYSDSVYKKADSMYWYEEISQVTKCKKQVSRSLFPSILLCETKKERKNKNKCFHVSGSKRNLKEYLGP
jgi:hypothetical protein